MSQQNLNLGTGSDTGDGDPLRTGATKIQANFTELYSMLGWGRYKDSTYTSGSPLVVNSGNSANINNDKDTVIETYLPTDVTTFVSSNKITPNTVGDYYIFTLRFKAKSSVNQGYANISIDIGGVDGKIFPEVITFPKGANIEHPFSILMSGFSLSTFVSNGGQPVLDAISGNISLYDYEIQINRTYKAII